MKNRKIVVAAFLLVAVMLLGVGYAAGTTHLNITGAATVSVEGASSAYSDDIKFTNVSQATDGDLAYTASIGDGKTADFSITGLKGAGDSVTITYTISNSGDLDSLVTLDVANGYPTNDNDEYFSIVVSGEAGDDYETAGVALGAGASITVKVTVTLKHTPTNSAAPTVGNFVVRLTSTSTEVQSGT